MRYAAAGLLLLAAATSEASAQRLDERRHGGSRPVATTFAILGAGLGMAAGATLIPRQPPCIDTSTTKCQLGPARIIAISAGAVFGAALGSRYGRSLTGGDQHFGHSVGGAFLGMLAGGLVYAAFEGREDVPALVSISIPAGTLATLMGW